MRVTREATLAVLMALFASTTASIGCGKLGGSKGSSASSTATALATAPEVPPGSGETGVADCDVFFAQYRCFLNTRMPEAEAESTISELRDKVKAASANPAERARAAESCREQQAAELAGFSRAGCAGDAGRGDPPESYPLTAIKPIADNCASPKVLITSAKWKEGVVYNWQWVRQTMYANHQFKVVTEAPTAPMQVLFHVVRDDTSIHLIASCKEGKTCNRLAAMYKAVVRSSSPQVYCGKVPVSGDERPGNLVPADGVWLPMEKTDVVARCARIAACMIATSIDTPGDPGLECQRAPSSFKVDCATKDSCAEVLACASR